VSPHSSRRPRRPAQLLLVLGIALLSLLAAASPAAARALRTGFADPLFTSTDPAIRDLWLQRANETGASVVRINVYWSSVAPEAVPVGFDPADADSPGYRWGALDAAVRDASAHDLAPLFTVYSAPAWAEGANRPAGAAPGSWEPQPDAYRAFAHALASRFSGSHPDPLNPGATLPAVRLYEAWNEPNLEEFLSPQWRGATPVAATIYRRLLDSFYAGVKGAQAQATVAAGALAPFGDEPGGPRTRPVLFLRSLLCLRGGRLKAVACPEKARFDVLSDHPIAVGPPARSARSPLDATTPDLGRLTRVLAAAEKKHLVRPASDKPLWVTEFWYDSNPPDPEAVPAGVQARWYEQDLSLFWHQGASLAVALQIRDAAAEKGYALSYQSGVYLLDGSPKPAQTALRFPLVAHRDDPFHVTVWGMAPQPGPVEIQRFRQGRWRNVAGGHSRGRGSPFQVKIPLIRLARIRARAGSDTSLAWTQH
jgi:hypothetical protein